MRATCEVSQHVLDDFVDLMETRMFVRPGDERAQFLVSPNTFTMAFDFYVRTHASASAQGDLRLLMRTAVFMASKAYDEKPIRADAVVLKCVEVPAPSTLRRILSSSRTLATRTRSAKMIAVASYEDMIVGALNWNLSAPTLGDFARVFCEIVGVPETKRMAFYVRVAHNTGFGTLGYDYAELVAGQMLESRLLQDADANITALHDPARPEAAVSFVSRVRTCAGRLRELWLPLLERAKAAREAKAVATVRGKS